MPRRALHPAPFVRTSPVRGARERVLVPTSSSSSWPVCRGRRLSHSRAAVCVCVSAELQKLLLLLPYRLETFVGRDGYQPLPTRCSAATHTYSAPPTYLPSWPDPILLPTFPRAQSSRGGPPLSGDFSPLRGEFIGRRTRRFTDDLSSRAVGRRRLFPGATERSLFHDFHHRFRAVNTGRFHR